ncbi:hypothetical protein DICVIV_08463 [Dictyocaulus viviparus]|uniref:Uncharacterized protein n=1 Tax=Dictyocaulus viviparus TaxID=29172 RepID=A0A0D8XSY4_DICVI|nr:hypothetical protein DICVIV_08463 [Dictyocaulus viviparus]
MQPNGAYIKERQLTIAMYRRRADIRTFNSDGFMICISEDGNGTADGQMERENSKQWRKADGTDSI